MKLKIDAAGRLVVPKPLRERLGLHPDLGIEVAETPDGILLKSASQQPSMVQRGGVWVHLGEAAEGIDWGRVVETARLQRAAAVRRGRSI